MTMMRGIAPLLLLFAYLCSLSCAWIMPNTSRRNRNERMTRTRLHVSSSSSNNNNNRNKDNAMLDFMSRLPDSSTGASSSQTIETLDDSIVDLVKTIAKAADGRKAEDIVALNVRAITSLCSALVILSGNSRPQNQAIAKAIQDDVEEEFGIVKLPEGTADSGWMLLDYGSVMVHIMTPKSRLYYNVEGQWREKGGVTMDLSDVLLPNSVLEQDENTQQLEIPQEQDPFWS